MPIFRTFGVSRVYVCLRECIRNLNGSQSSSDLKTCQEIINSYPKHIINTDTNITSVINMRIKTIIQDGRVSL